MKASTILFIVFLMGCGAGRNKTSVELIQDMMEQKNLKSQEFDSVRGEPANRVPPEGTVPRGYTPYRFSGRVLEAESKLLNPLAGSKEFAASLERGAEMYRIYCSVCHGLTGAGDGKIAKFFPLIPALNNEKVKAFKDGRIYHIIYEGQGLMGSYATQISSSTDRWSIVNYVRTLQQK